MIIAGIISPFAFVESEERPPIGQRISQTAVAIRAHPDAAILLTFFKHPRASCRRAAGRGRRRSSTFPGSR
jgi:hypothetical protein